MEVAPPVNPTDFDFNSYAYTTAPSTPRLITGDKFSAPTRPARSVSGKIYREFDQILILDDSHDTRRRNSPATVPFAWEEKPGVPKSTNNLFTKDFAFDVSGEFFPDSYVSADDLFHDGMIVTKPVDIEPPSATVQYKNEMRLRGRERNSSGLSSSRTRRTRSLPPVIAFEQLPAPAITAPPASSSACSTLSASGSGKWSKKWSFKDLFLFRSASDGRALERDPLKKYSATFRKHDEDCRNLSLRDRSGSGSGSKRRGWVSAHELHYTVNRAVSNDMKKKTFLPYKQGILGRLAFNPSVHALSNGFGFSHKN